MDFGFWQVLLLNFKYSLIREVPITLDVIDYLLNQVMENCDLSGIEYEDLRIETFHQKIDFIEFFTKFYKIDFQEFVKNLEPKTKAKIIECLLYTDDVAITRFVEKFTGGYEFMIEHLFVE